MNEERKPHKHAELIKAWADGATIQYQEMLGKWFDCIGNPEWWCETKYRIKPEPRPDIVRLTEIRVDGWLYFSDGESNLRLTFSGETGELLKAEVI